MSLVALTATDRDIALECVRFLLESEVLLDNELYTRVGLTRAELRVVFAKWPHLEDAESGHPDYIAMNNCFNEVCNGLELTHEEWQKWFSVSRNAVCETFARWHRNGDA